MEHSLLALGPQTDYQVNLDCFEGPLDLLLYLIKKEEVAIYDISLEKITKQYLSYLQQLEQLQVEVAGEFIVMAAHLIYIKSRMLLPREMTPEEEPEEDHPGWELIRQLIEYKKFKDAAISLEDKDQEALLLYSHVGRDSKEIIKTLPPHHGEEGTMFFKEVTLLDLFHAFDKILQKRAKENEVTEIYAEEYSVSDRISYLQERFEHHQRLSFNQLFHLNSSKEEKIVTFLALLELVRNYELLLSQEQNCSTIWISKRPQLPSLTQTPPVQAP